MNQMWYLFKIFLVERLFRLIQKIAPGNCILHIHAKYIYSINGENVKNPAIYIPSKWVYEYEDGKRISRMAPTERDMAFGISFFI